MSVSRNGGGPPGEGIGDGTYRLLFRVMASHPEEVRSFYEDTVARIVAYDEQYSTDLVGTLDAYLQSNCNMNQTAQAIHAHRHTIGYRLERVKELTGLDPLTSEDRERLGLGSRPTGSSARRCRASAYERADGAGSSNSSWRRNQNDPPARGQPSGKSSSSPCPPYGVKDHKLHRLPIHWTIAPCCRK